MSYCMGPVLPWRLMGLYFKELIRDVLERGWPSNQSVRHAGAG